MNNIRKSLLILFQNQNPAKMLKNLNSKRMIFKNEVKISSLLDKNDFTTLFQYEYNTLYNKDEVLNLCSILENKWSNGSGIHGLIMKFAEDVLVEENGKPVCEFENVLRWRELTFYLGEDVFTTAYFAKKDSEIGYNRNYFTWPSIIGTNNNRLKEILKKGTAENHFHLNGSSPHFQLSWISLMNNVVNREKEFKKLTENKKLYPTINTDFDEPVENIEELVLKASIIRKYLYNLYVLENKNKDEDRDKIYKELNTNLILKSEVQNELDTLKYFYGKKIGEEIPDYAIPKNISEMSYYNNTQWCNGNILLYGERFFLYKLFKYILNNKSKKDKKVEDLLYIYLCIKQSFRKEIIQVNQVVGFANFADYQDRKENFLKEGSIYSKAVINIAINSSIVDQKIQFLETRIAPKPTVKSYISSLEKIRKNSEDTALFHQNSSIESFLEKLNKGNNSKLKGEYFHTIHFIKNSKKEKNNELLEWVEARNFELRKQIYGQAIVLSKLRSSLDKMAKRVYGIDAANVEIGCRPEVFGEVFRFLKNFKPQNISNILLETQANELGLTYHVGEDFLDIVDGLRAIDETLLFLNFTHGDRFGHALALGVDPLEYYSTKERVVLLSKQMLLDNIAWLIYKKNNLNIEISGCLNSKLEEVFNKNCREVYEETYPLNVYIDSWKLRGDDPYIYFKNFEDKEEGIIDSLGKFKLNNAEIVKNARKNKKACELYKRYHFDALVRKKGNCIIEYKIDNEFIDLVWKLQNGMQLEIARKNISIETNPSSNYLIGTFNRYDKHPITRFYNLGLNKEEGCSQLHVSINTDDQGVFSTSLENEYALMALALCKEKNKDNTYKHNQNSIYEWLNKIREMGLEQSFMNRNKS